MQAQEALSGHITEVLSVSNVLSMKFANWYSIKSHSAQLMIGLKLYN
jgi:hypothetical protein